jgi:all-beta uncharacterized protein
MRFSIAPKRRHWLAGTILLATALTYPISGNAVTICRDGNELSRGVPERFNYVSVDGVSQPHNDIATSIYGGLQPTNFYPPGGEFYDEGTGDDTGGTVLDLDVMVKFKHPRINETMVWLRHTIFSESGPPDVLTIPLTAFDGCNSGDYDQRTEFNQDMAVYFDDAAIADVQFACDRSIPTIQGRLNPSNAGISDGDPTTEETIGLDSFIGRQIFGNSTWELILFDDSGLGETGALVEWCLVFNTREEGDIAPREETATISPAQSGNGILTISDHVDTALVLLDYLDLDNRLIERESIDLSEHEGEAAPDVSGSDPATQLPVQITINEDQYENLRRSSGLEFTVMDTAPASSNGDGRITVADWVQTTRYAAGVGFDTPVASNGALAPSDRLVWAGNTTIPRGLVQEIPIYMRSKNVEHEIAFGLQFNPEQLELQNVEAGPCIPENAIFELKNQANANTTGQIGLQVGLLPDQTFLCNYQVRPGLIENGDDKIDAAFDNDETKPTSVPFELEATIGGFNFDDPQVPTVTIDFELSNNSDTIVTDYDFNIIYDHYRLKLQSDYESVYNGSAIDRPSLFNGATLPSLPNLRILNASYDSENSSTFQNGTLFSIEFEIINTWLDSNGGVADQAFDAFATYVAPPSLYLDKSNKTTINASIVGDNSALTYTKYISTDVNPIENPIEISIIDAAESSSTAVCPTSPTIQLYINIDKNIQPITQFQFQLAQSTTNDINVETPLTPGSINEFFGTNKLILINSSTFANITGGNDVSQFMNGNLVELETSKASTISNFISAPLAEIFSGDNFAYPKLKIRQRNPFFFNCSGTKEPLNTLADIALGLDKALNPQQAPTEQPATAKSRKATSTSLTSKLDRIVKDTNGNIIITVGIDVENLPADVTDLTDFHLLMTYEPGTLELLEVTGENGFSAALFGRNAECADIANDPELPSDVFGLPFDEDCKAPWGDPGVVPVNSRANFDTLLLEGEKAPSSFTGGRLATLTYKVVGKTTTAPSIIFTELAPIAQPVKIASMFFKAKSGDGAAVTNLDFIPDPITFIAPTVRNVAGAPIYSAFASAGVTIIDNADSRPTVRVVDTVLASDTNGTVQIALDSVGVENAIGFKIKYDPSLITLNSVSPGRHIPSDGFFFTYPSQNDISSANIKGELSVLVSNQPGAAFEVGRRILANLQVDPIATSDPIDAFFEFLPLYDAAEVVDPFGTPIVTRFPRGTVNIAGDNCQYFISDGDTVADDDGSGTGTPDADDDDPLGASYGIAGGSGMFEVTVDSGCPWTAVTDSDWVTLISGDLGVGNGTVFFTVDPNIGQPRNGTIELAGNIYSIQQAGCTFDLDFNIETFNSKGGSSSFEVQAADDACDWIAQSDDSWIILTNAGFGTGNGNVAFDVERNTGTRRVGTISVSMADDIKTFEVRQEVCQYFLTPDTILDVPAEGGVFDLVLTTTPEPEEGAPDSAKAPWVLTTSNEWLEFPTEDLEGRGNTVLSLTVTSNIADDRFGTISIEDQITTVTQLGITDCNYAIEPIRLDFPSDGSSKGQFDVVVDEGCPWQISLEPGVDWITIENAETTDIGSVTLYYNVAINEGNKRQSIITVGKAEHTVFQFAEGEYAYEFRSNEQGWTTGGQVGDFTEPNAGWGEGDTTRPGHLFLEAVDNTNTYGFWKSPLLEPSEPESPTSPTLYQVDYEVTSNVLSTNVPTFRMRHSTKNFALSTVQVATSAGSGSFSPSEAGKDYRQYFELLPEEVDRFHSFFEILSFDPNQAVAPATLRLENISIIPIKPYTDYLSDLRSEGKYVLANETTAAQWNAIPSGATIDPEFIRSGRGLEIGAGIPTGSSEIAVVGFWTFNSDIDLVEDRLYEVKFTVGARTKNGLPVRKELVPTFRLRLNDSTFKSSAYLNVDSRKEVDRYGFELDPVVPTFSQSQEYTVWFKAPAELNGKMMLMAFDLIYTLGDDPETNLILEQVEVNSYMVQDASEE